MRHRNGHFTRLTLLLSGRRPVPFYRETRRSVLGQAVCRPGPHPCHPSIRNPRTATGGCAFQKVWNDKENGTGRSTFGLRDHHKKLRNDHLDNLAWVVGTRRSCSWSNKHDLGYTHRSLLPAAWGFVQGEPSIDYDRWSVTHCLGIDGTIKAETAHHRQN